MTLTDRKTSSSTSALMTFSASIKQKIVSVHGTLHPIEAMDCTAQERHSVAIQLRPAVEKTPDRKTCLRGFQISRATSPVIRASLVSYAKSEPERISEADGYRSIASFVHSSFVHRTREHALVNKIFTIVVVIGGARPCALYREMRYRIIN